MIGHFNNVEKRGLELSLGLFYIYNMWEHAGTAGQQQKGPVFVDFGG